jgi:hypothetical protein
MEQLYSYNFWKQLLTDLNKSGKNYFLCSNSLEFTNIWYDEDLKSIVISFAKDFLSQSKYADLQVGTGNTTNYYLFYNLHNKSKVSDKRIRQDFCKYMMLRTAYSEKDGVGDF